MGKRNEASKKASNPQNENVKQDKNLPDENIKPGTSNTQKAKQPDPNQVFDLIAFEEGVSVSGNIRLEAPLKISASLSSEDCGSQSFGKRAVYGNPAGLDMFRELQEIKDKQAQMSETITATVTHQLRRVTLRLAGFASIRQRFLDIFKRDVLHISRAKLAYIKLGNQAAYEGDVVADASLYEEKERADTEVFVALYGISPTRAIKLFDAEDHDSIAVLNRMATIRTRKQDGGDPVLLSDALKSAFERFTRALMDDEKFPKLEATSELGLEYWAFWKQANKYG